MDRQKVLDYYKKIKLLLEKSVRKALEYVKAGSALIKDKITSWWQIIFGVLFVLVFLYYPIGGWLINSIDTSSRYKPESNNGNLATIDMISHLVNREVHDKIWTPNLPFVFPSYFLDNMPNFQLGLMTAVGNTAAGLEKLKLQTVSDTARVELDEASELLQYPGDVWLFSKQNKLLPAPSSGTQYKKGRKKLNNFNNEMALGKVVIARDASNLLGVLRGIRRDMSRQIAKTEGYIRENQKNTFDFGADDVFYFSQGKFYAYAQILKALGGDFKNVLVKYDVYQQWTTMIKSLDEASDLNPSMVRNAKINSSWAPNHLLAINYFAARAINRLDNIIVRLRQSEVEVK